MADVAQDREAVLVRQAEVEDRRRIAGRGDRRAGLGRRRQQIGIVAGAAQALLQQLGQLRVVFDH